MRIVADRSKELSDFIAQQVQREITSLKVLAQEEENKILLAVERRANEQAEQIREESKRQAAQLKENLIASANTELNTDLNKEKLALYNRVLASLRLQLEQLPKEEKEMLALVFLKHLLRRIEEMGLQKEEFQFRVWSGFSNKALSTFSLKKVQRNLDELAVEAESETLLLKDSLDHHLEGEKEFIIKKIIEQV